MSRTRYPTVAEGQWVKPIRTGYRFCCCDCSLVHRVDFRFYKGRIYFRAFRDSRATGQLRRHRRTRG